MVHRCAYHYRGKQSEKELGQIAIIAVGWAVPNQSVTNLSALQRRLLPHAQACSSWVLESEPGRGLEGSEQPELCFEEGEEVQTLLVAIRRIGILYAGQGKLAEAALLHELALRGKEEVLGPKHILTLPVETVASLGNVYMNQGRLAEAEHMIRRALQGFDSMLPPKHASTLRTVGNLGMVYKKQGKLADAELLFEQVLQEMEETLGPKHIHWWH